MAEKIILSYSGWCECSTDQINFVKVSSDANIPEVITGTEWLALTPTEDEGTIGPYRDDYILKDVLEAQITALDGLYTDWWIEVEENNE